MSSTEILRELVAIPSESGQEHLLAGHLAERCATLGFSVIELADSVIARTAGVDPTKAFILNGHIDTVPKTEHWSRDPLTLREDTNNPDRLIGLGATDMKAGIGVMLDVAHDSAETRPPCDLWLTFSSNEETTGSGSQAVAGWMSHEFEDRYKISGGLILEPTDARFVGVGHRGDTVWNVTATGPGGHASQHFNNEAPPIEKLASLLASLPAVREDWATKYENTLLGMASVNPTVIRAGHAENVVPVQAEALLNLRVTPELIADLTQIRETLATKHGVTISEAWKPYPSICSSDEHIYKVMQAVLPTTEFRAFPGATDQRYFSEHGIPMLIFGPGAIEAMHQPDEWVSQSAIRRCREVVSLALANF